MAAEHPSAFNDITVGRNADGDLQPRGSKYPTTCPNGFNTRCVLLLMAVNCLLFVGTCQHCIALNPYAYNLCSPDWDPVTGLGTPHWDVLRDLALQLP